MERAGLRYFRVNCCRACSMVVLGAGPARKTWHGRCAVVPLVDHRPPIPRKSRVVCADSGGQANKKQNPSNGRCLPRWLKFWNVDIRQDSQTCLRVHKRLGKKDGHANCQERHRPCKFVEVQQDAAFHGFLPSCHCPGKAWSVLSRNLCKVSRFVGWL